MKILKRVILFTAIFMLLFGCDLTNPELKTDSRIQNLKVENADFRIVSGEEAGMSPALYPQIKMISREEYDAMTGEEMDDATGLYLIGIDYIPEKIEEELAEGSYTLNDDGSLINNDTGEATVLFIEHTRVEIIPAGNSKGSSDNFTAEWFWKKGRKGFIWYTYWNEIKVYTYKLGTSTSKNVEHIRAEVTTQGASGKKNYRGYDGCARFPEESCRGIPANGKDDERKY